MNQTDVVGHSVANHYNSFCMSWYEDDIECSEFFRDMLETQSTTLERVIPCFCYVRETRRVNRAVFPVRETRRAVQHWLECRMAHRETGRGGLDCFPYFIVLLSQTNERNATPGERMNDKNRFSRDLLRVSTIFDGVIVQVVRNHFFSSSFHNVSKLYV